MTAGPDASAGYRGKVYLRSGCAQNPIGERFVGLEELVATMGANGLKLYASKTTSLTAGPDGIIGANDVVVIKINYQWTDRGGTNTDVLRGLVRMIIDHPDGFTGEVVIAENTQNRSNENFDRSTNNAQDISLSPRDIEQSFRARGRRVSIADWRAIASTPVGEYSTGDMADGYVLGEHQPAIGGRPSYPKFKTADGSYVSLKYGTWTESSGYDRERLALINVPVLKSHHAQYGATACVKNYMGLVTCELETNAHWAMGQGLMGSVIGELEPAQLHILDAVWINADPYSGPATSYAEATRRDALVAGIDPVAADIWAVKNILVPAFIENGHTPPWPEPSADPDDPNSAFRRYLDSSMQEILAAGYDVTNDLEAVDLFDLAPPGTVSDPRGAGAPFSIRRLADAYELSWSVPPTGGPVDTYYLYRTRLDAPEARARPECETELGSGSSAVLSYLPQGYGFIVVGHNLAGDGSFGFDSRGAERPSPRALDVCP
ncbi:MAG: DUF362 domain-containing protein [Acidobacteriota bacterium]|nr:MAG: DUF362 domain-containing protein [Acidobacteriota bacterium]